MSAVFEALKQLMQWMRVYLRFSQTLVVFTASRRGSLGETIDFHVEVMACRFSLRINRPAVILVYFSSGLYRNEVFRGCKHDSINNKSSSLRLLSITTTSTTATATATTTTTSTDQQSNGSSSNNHNNTNSDEA